MLLEELQLSRLKQRGGSALCSRPDGKVHAPPVLQEGRGD